MINEQTKLLAIDYRETFAGKHGERVLADLDKKGLYRNGDLFNVSSSRQTDFNLGVNSLVRYIHQMIEKNLDEEKQHKAKSEGVQL